MKRLLTSDGVELAVDVHGPADAPVAVVLLHGWCLSSEIYRHQRRALAGHPVRVVSYDVRGHGRSGKAPLGTTTVAQVAADLRTVLTEVCGELPAVLVGHSLGGMTVMALAEAEPDLVAERVGGVAFVNTAAGNLDRIRVPLLPRRLTELVRGSVSWELRRRRDRHLARGDGPVRHRITDALVARYVLFGRDVPREDFDLGVRLVATTHPVVTEGFLDDLQRHDRHRALERLREVPVSILAGTADRLTPLQHSRRMARALPHARLTVFPGAGHMLPLERPDEVTAEVLRLCRLTAPGRLTARAPRRGADRPPRATG